MTEEIYYYTDQNGISWGVKYEIDISDFDSRIYVYKKVFEWRVQ